MLSCHREATLGIYAMKNSMVSAEPGTGRKRGSRGTGSIPCGRPHYLANGVQVCGSCTFLLTPPGPREAVHVVVLEVSPRGPILR